MTYLDVNIFQAGSVDVLHCYYAHGEDNENFQRRSYWMLEEYVLQNMPIFLLFRPKK